MIERILKKSGLEIHRKSILEFRQKVSMVVLRNYFMMLNELVHFFDNFLFKYLIDKATLFNKGQIDVTTLSSMVLIALGVYLAVKLVGAVIWFFTFRAINSLEAKVMNDIEKKSFWHIINLSYRFHINKRTGSLISKFTRGKQGRKSPTRLFSLLLLLFSV